MKNRICVLIIKYNARELEEYCITSLICNTRDKYDLFVIDNYPESRNIHTIWNEWIRKLDELGYSHVCLLNSDTLILKEHSDWISKLLEPFKNSEVIATGPLTNKCGNRRQMLKKGKTKEFIKQLSGFCLMLDIKKTLDLNGFDENFGFYGGESDLLDRAFLRGYKSVLVRDAFVFHHAGGSIKKNFSIEEQNEIKKKAKDLITRLRNERRK